MDEDLVAFAVGLATRAGDLAARMFLAGTSRTHKPDGTEVTAADIAVEELIRTEIARYAPDDGVLGEEFGEAPGRSGRRWVTDPISGTGYFTRRMPLFATLLAVEDAQGPAVAVIDQPMQRELVFAVRGGGCHVLTDRATDPRAAHRARVSTRPDAAGALTLTANQHAWSDALMRAMHPRVALVGAVHHGAVHIATGRVDALVMTHQGSRRPRRPAARRRRGRRRRIRSGRWTGAHRGRDGAHRPTRPSTPGCSPTRRAWRQRAARRSYDDAAPRRCPASGRRPTPGRRPAPGPRSAGPRRRSAATVSFPRAARARAATRSAAR